MQTSRTTDREQANLAPSRPVLPPTPLSWRLLLAALVVVLAGLAYRAAGWLGPRGQAALGVGCFIGVAAVFSSNLRALNGRTFAWGFGLQVLLALCVLKLEVFGHRPGYEFFAAVAGVVKQ